MKEVKNINKNLTVFLITFVLLFIIIYSFSSSIKITGFQILNPGNFFDDYTLSLTSNSYVNQGTISNVQWNGLSGVSLVSAGGGIATNGLLGHWKFDDSISDGVATDSSGQGYSGTCTIGTNCPILDTTNPRIGTGAFTFDGIDDVVNILDGWNTQSNLDTSISLWIRTVENNANRRLVSTYAGYGENSIDLSLNNQFDLMRFKGGVNPSITYSWPNSNHGVWKQLVATRRSSDGRVELYVDGILIGSVISITGNLALNLNDFLRIGNLFQGSIDDVSIWNRVLTLSEIQSLASGSTIGAGSSTGSFESNNIITSGYNSLTTTWVGTGVSMQISVDDGAWQTVTNGQTSSLSGSSVKYRATLSGASSSLDNVQISWDSSPPVPEGVTRYWVGGSGNWQDINHWSDISGGVGGVGIPGVSDNVFFDLNSAGIVTLTGNVNVGSVNILANTPATLRIALGGFTLTTTEDFIGLSGGLTSVAGSTLVVGGNLDTTALDISTNPDTLNIHLTGTGSWRYNIGATGQPRPFQPNLNEFMAAQNGQTTTLIPLTSPQGIDINVRQLILGNGILTFDESGSTSVPSIVTIEITSPGTGNILDIVSNGATVNLDALEHEMVGSSGSALLQNNLVFGALDTYDITGVQAGGIIQANTWVLNGNSDFTPSTFVIEKTAALDTNGFGFHVGNLYVGSGNPLTGIFHARSSIVTIDGVLSIGRSSSNNGQFFSDTGMITANSLSSGGAGGFVTGENSVLELMGSAPVGNSVFYVSNSGDDLNPGTQALPFATLAKAIQFLGSGVTVLFERGGVYSVSNGFTFNPSGGDIGAYGNGERPRWQMNSEGTLNIINTGWNIYDTKIQFGTYVSNAVCGDGIIGLGEICDDGNPNSGDGCSDICEVESGFSCSSNSNPPPISICTAIATCDLTSATWSVSSAIEGDTVTLNTQGSGCSGDTFNFEVYENDIFLDDLVDSFTSTLLNPDWTVIYQYDGFLQGEPEYYFEVSVVSDPSEIVKSSTPDLTVTPLIPSVCGNGIIELGEQCDDGGTISGDGCSNTCLLESSLNPTIPNLKVAFVSDTGWGNDFQSVLELIASENADAVVHSGDEAYSGDVSVVDNWKAQIASTLGVDFPYLITKGNHETLVDWNTLYGPYLQGIIDNNGITCTGGSGANAGINTVCDFQGLNIILSGVGEEFDTGISRNENENFLSQELSNSGNLWNICAWHRNQNAMQLGQKGNEVGWNAYEICKDAGAIIATGHEHSYARTNTLTSMISQTVDPTLTSSNMEVGLGKSFAFHSGLGGNSIRDQVRCLPTTYPYGCNGEWASIYTSDQGANFGALFIEFNVGGNPSIASGYFKNVNGQIIDQFTITNTLGSVAPPDSSCGNNIIETGEVCDGTALSGQTCQTQGFDGGTLSCASDCLSYDTSLCANNPPALCQGTCVATNLHSTYSDDPMTSVYVSWRGQSTDDVEYGITPSFGSNAQASSFTSEGDLQHHVEITGLSPGTKYYYRVGGSVETGSFTTAPSGSPDFTILLAGDIQYAAQFGQNYFDAWNFVLQNHPNPIDFVMSVGDEVSHGLIQNEWDNYFITSGEMMRERVNFPAIGNHETYIDNAHEEFIPQPFLDQFRFPDNGHNRFKDYWYSFEYGDALFIVMSWNINSQTEPTLRAEMYEEQRIWLEQVLSQTNKKWKFVTLHRPTYSVYRTQILEDSSPEWNELWETYDVNAVINGDTEFWEQSVPIYQGVEVSSYEEGTLYHGTAGFRGSPTGGNAWFVADSQQVDDEPFVTVLDVTANTATITTYNYITGAIRSAVTLPDRSGGVTLPCSLNSASWSAVTAVEGDSVTLNVQGSGCSGETYTYDIYEVDPLQNDLVESFSSSSLNPQWIALHVDDGLFGGDPEYQFVVSLVSDPTVSVTSSLPYLEVTPLPVAVCGNGVIETGEQCDDGNIVQNPADGCSSTCQVESGWNCAGEPSVCTYIGGDSECSDGIDNDGDGLIDYPADPGCSSASDNDETDPVIPLSVDYYVCDCLSGSDSDCVVGNDNNNGLSEGTAFQTYEKARQTFGNMPAGETIGFCRGGVHEVIGSGGSSNRWENSNCLAESRCGVTSYVPSWGSGDEDKPILRNLAGTVISFANGGSSDHQEGYIFRDLEIVGGYNEQGDGFFLYNDIDDVELDDLVIRGFMQGINLGGNNGVGPGSDGRNDRITLKNSYVLDNARQGWLGSCDDCVVEDNIFENNGGLEGLLDHNVYLSGQTSDGMRVSRNVLYRSAIPGINPTGGECLGVSLVVHGVKSNLIIEDNYIYEDIGGAGNGCWGISVDPGGISYEEFEGLIIRRNKVENVGNMGIGCQSCSNAIIENNIIIQEQSISTTGINIPDKTSSGNAPTDNVDVRGNTIYFGPSSSGTGIRVGGTEGTGYSITSNIIQYAGTGDFNCINTDERPASDYEDINNNLCFGPNSLNFEWEQGSGSLASWQAISGFDSNSVVANPLLISTISPYDLSIPQNSPAVNTGHPTLSPTDDYNGNLRDSMPDIGAFEFGSVSQSFDCSDDVDNDGDGDCDFDGATAGVNGCSGNPDIGCSSALDDDESNVPLTCDDCGVGLLNICDRNECTVQIAQSCYYNQGIITGTCSACTQSTVCEDYGDDETSCLANSCGISGNCQWNSGSGLCETAGSVCGNGVIETGEQCDDGGTVSGDGCSSTCQVESIGQDGNQCSDGVDNDGDGLIDYPVDLGCTSSVDNDENDAVFISNVDYYVCDCLTGADGDCVAGSDSNDGLTPGTALRTYEQARQTFNGMQAGETIAFCDGGYFSPSGSTNWVNNNCINGNRCTIANYAPNWGSGDESRPTIQSSGDGISFLTSSEVHNEGVNVFNLILLGSETGNGVFFWNDKDYVTMDNLYIEGFQHGVYVSGPIGIDNDGHILRNSVVKNNHGQGWLGGGGDTTIENNYFENNGGSANNPNRDHNIYYSGVGVANTIIRNNEMTRAAVPGIGTTGGLCSGTELVVHGDVDNLIIEGNYIHNEIGEAGGGCWGISVNAGYSSPEHFSNLIIRKNKIVNVGNQAIGCSSCTDAKIENNVIIQDQSDFSFRGIKVPNNNPGTGDITTNNVDIIGNTIYLGSNAASSSSATGIEFDSSNLVGTGYDVASNIIVYMGTDNNFNCLNTAGRPASDFDTIDNNLCFTPNAPNSEWEQGSGSLVAWQGSTGFDQNSLTSNPQLVNPISDLSISQNSPAVDAGHLTLSPVDDFNGNLRDSMPDIGAFEFGSVSQSFECSDGIDNDGDGLIDYPADPGCSSALDDDETDVISFTNLEIINTIPFGSIAVPTPNQPNFQATVTFPITLQIETTAGVNANCERTSANNQNPIQFTNTGGQIHTTLVNVLPGFNLPIPYTFDVTCREVGNAGNSNTGQISFSVDPLIFNFGNFNGGNTYVSTTPWIPFILALEIQNHGEIEFQNQVAFSTGYIFGNLIEIQKLPDKHRVFVDSQNIPPLASNPAVLRFYDAGNYIEGYMKKDGVLCGIDCTPLFYETPDIVKITVSGFSEYTLEEGCFDEDLDTYYYDNGICTTGDLDCDDQNGGVNPGAAEVCGDSLDNNCDGNIDEGCSSPGPDSPGGGGSSGGSGGGSSSSGVSGVQLESALVSCNDGIDNDLDGFIDYPDDAGCVTELDNDESDDGMAECTPGEIQEECGSDVGACSMGVIGCTEDGYRTKCLNSVSERVEVRDGLDNDCNGEVDEGFLSNLQVGLIIGGIVLILIIITVVLYRRRNF